MPSRLRPSSWSAASSTAASASARFIRRISPTTSRAPSTGPGPASTSTCCRASPWMSTPTTTSMLSTSCGASTPAPSPWARSPASASDRADPEAPTREGQGRAMACTVPRSREHPHATGSRVARASALAAAGLAALAFAALLAPSRLAGQADPASRASNQPVAPFRILGNLHYVGASDVTSFLISTSAGLILIDGGFVETAPQIRDNIARLGFALRDVKILLNSHAHFDHAGGLAQLKAWTGARLFASAGDAPLLEAGGRGDPFFGDKAPFRPVKV